MTLRYTTLCLYTDEQAARSTTHCSNSLSVSHALATRAPDYTKRKHVFRLDTADMAQYLIQTRSAHFPPSALGWGYFLIFVITINGDWGNGK